MEIRLNSVFLAFKSSYVDNYTVKTSNSIPLHSKNQLSMTTRNEPFISIAMPKHKGENVNNYQRYNFLPFSFHKSNFSFTLNNTDTIYIQFNLQNHTHKNQPSILLKIPIDYTTTIER